ncbi:AraC-type DNA-binding protein [Pseudarcicella hirudinis]|uniref:AraC-type DNA-binding protein n=2 Tax=Pseudarcicella hirudinis TaxID=1079859 RepID=A0A1I5U5N5_9BACT|nr:AraC-type DNA-binding protein [Pseudarcicella hirudinis]
MYDNITLNFEFTDLSSDEWKRDSIFCDMININNDCWFGYISDTKAMLPFQINTPCLNNPKAIVVIITNVRNKKQNSSDSKFCYFGFYINLQHLSYLANNMESQLGNNLSELRINIERYSVLAQKLIDDFEVNYKCVTQKQSFLILWGQTFLFHFAEELFSIETIFPEDVRKIEQLLLLITANLTKSRYSIQQMADKVGMSMTKFKTVFKNVTGDSPYQYIQKARLTKAIDLLKTSQYSVTEVAYKVGFRHPGTFTRFFKQKYNCSPSDLI